MNQTNIPKDSLLHYWINYMSATEVPFSYQVGACLTALGALLRRQRYVDQVDWKVYPNQSVLFIGPSGIGKDTVINRASRIMSHFEWLARVPTIGGTTFENIQERLAQLSKPACAYLPAAEMTKLFGKADYQANMLTGITDLLSTSDKIDITTKGRMVNAGTPQYIWEPTLTMHAGSTVEWLHKHMPDGTLEGGFLGRFLILVEEFGRRQVPLVKGARSAEELKHLKRELDSWNTGVEDILVNCRAAREVILLNEASDMYVNWYYNRFKQFSRAVLPYANRSRDMVLRLAMLMAISRRHLRWIDAEDMQFGIDVIKLVAEKIDKVVLPPTDEAVVAMKILELLPATTSELYATLAMRYSSKIIEMALNMLTTSKKARLDRQRGVYSVWQETK